MKGVHQGTHCAVEQMSVFIELIGKFQLMVVHQIVVDDHKEWLVGREGLQTASCTSVTYD